MTRRNSLPLRTNGYATFFIPSDMQHNGAATDLAIFGIVLMRNGWVHEGGEEFSTPWT
jgi:hypothetical protein